MKCPYCDGKGYYYQESSYGMELVQCNCQNKMTNEEYLKSCNTEQLADVLWEKINGAFNSGYACCNLKQDKDYISRYKRFKEWLKQHTRMVNYERRDTQAERRGTTAGME